MKKTPSFLPVALVLVLATTSCRSYRYPYAASHIHQPLLVKKQDASLDATYSFGPAKGRADSSSNRGMDLQAAYAFSNHIAVMASWAFRRESDGFQNDYENIYDTSLVRYRRNFFEAGAGYFTADAGRKFVFSVYGGVGKGTLHIDDAIRSFGVSDTRFYSADLLKYFLQPGISFVEDENVHAAVCIRFSYVTYTNIKTDYPGDDMVYYRLDKLHDPVLFTEPSFRLRVQVPGAPWLAFTGSSSLIFKSAAINTRTWNLAFGISVDPVRALR